MRNRQTDDMLIDRPYREVTRQSVIHAGHSILIGITDRERKCLECINYSTWRNKGNILWSFGKEEGKRTNRRNVLSINKLSHFATLLVVCTRTRNESRAHDYISWTKDVLARSRWWSWL